MNANTNLGMLIYTKREEKGITRKQLAKLLNINLRTIYYYEDLNCDSKRKPNLIKLFQLAMILDIPLSDMLFENNMSFFFV